MLFISLGNVVLKICKKNRNFLIFLGREIYDFVMYCCFMISPLIVVGYAQNRQKFFSSVYFHLSFSNICSFLFFFI